MLVDRSQSKQLHRIHREQHMSGANDAREYEGGKACLRPLHAESQMLPVRAVMGLLCLLVLSLRARHAFNEWGARMRTLKNRGGCLLLSARRFGRMSSSEPPIIFGDFR